MAEVAAPAPTDAGAAAACPIQVVPLESEYKGTLPAKAVHTVTNTSTVRQCIKIKVYDARMVSCRPTCALLKPAEQVTLTFQHARFDFNPAEQAEYEKRKIGICYVEAPDTATSAMAFQKDVPVANWKMVKLQVVYKLEPGEKAPLRATKSAGAVEGIKSAAKPPVAATKSANAILQATIKSGAKKVADAKKSAGNEKKSAAAAPAPAAPPATPPATPTEPAADAQPPPPAT